MINRAGDLHKVNDDDENEEEVFTDEQLNEIISRNDEEYEIFTKMDHERYDREDRDARIALIKQKKPHKAHLAREKINYRLI